MVILIVIIYLQEESVSKASNNAESNIAPEDETNHAALAKAIGQGLGSTVHHHIGKVIDDP